MRQECKQQLQHIRQQIIQYKFTGMQRAHNYLEQNSMGHPQRRRMYNLNNLHNLKSRVQFSWLQSLDSDPMKKSNVIELKRQAGLVKAIDKYNSYVDKELGSLFSGDRFATIALNDVATGPGNQNRKKHQYELSTSKIYGNYNKSIDQPRPKQQSLDKSLNQQIEHFNQKNQMKRSLTISSKDVNTNPNRTSRAIENIETRNSQQRNRYMQQAFQLSPKFLKQLVLRSALDRPQVYNNFEGSKDTIRNIKPDNLESYLRIGQKRTNR